eukprot:3437654-Pleurochrysis_carterae.AAC.1
MPTCRCASMSPIAHDVPDRHRPQRCCSTLYTYRPVRQPPPPVIPCARVKFTAAALLRAQACVAAGFSAQLADAFACGFPRDWEALLKGKGAGEGPTRSVAGTAVATHACRGHSSGHSSGQQHALRCIVRPRRGSLALLLPNDPPPSSGSR